MLSDEKKIEIATDAAKIVSAKYKRGIHIPLNVLINTAFIAIKSDVERRARAQAYYSALNFAHKANLKRNRLPSLLDCDRNLRANKAEVDIDAVLDVRSALMQLTEDERELLLLHYVDDVRYADIAKLYNKKSRTTIHYKIKKVVKKLRLLLGGYE